MTSQPAGPVSFDRIAHRYDETRGGAKRGAEMVADLERLLVPGPILEVGVGTGLVSAALTGAGHTALGVDISPLMAARARDRLGRRVAVGDARTLPVRDASVDNVLFVWALHLVGDIPAALAQARRVVRDNGRVIAFHGGPDVEPSDLKDATAPLDGIRLGRARPDTDEALATAAAVAGLTVLYNEWSTAWPIELTPNTVAEQISSRVWSYLWSLDEDAWRAHVVPVVENLRALPDPDRPRRYHQRHRISVFTP
jgi:SAM-dependent methyltransferase